MFPFVQDDVADKNSAPDSSPHRQAHAERRKSKPVPTDIPTTASNTTSGSRRRRRGPRWDELCVFVERHSADGGYSEIQSAVNRTWFVGFSPSGVLRRLVVPEYDQTLPVQTNANAGSRAPMLLTLRRYGQFMKIDFAYVEDAAAETPPTLGQATGASGGGSRQQNTDQQRPRQSNQQRKPRHEYHGPSVTLREVSPRPRRRTASTTTATTTTMSASITPTPSGSRWSSSLSTRYNSSTSLSYSSSPSITTTRTA